MKKLTIFFLSLIFLCSLVACGSQGNDDNASANKSASLGDTKDGSGQSESSLDESSAKGKEKTLVVYYSATGNTRDIADYIAEAVKADVFELKPVEPYSSSDLDWTDRNSRVSQEYADPEKRVMELESTTVQDWEDYNTIFIGYPIWWGIAAWPVDAFIAANDFTGKTVIPFCTSSTSGLGESGELLAKSAGTGNWLEGERFSSRASKESVQKWIEDLDL